MEIKECYVGQFKVRPKREYNYTYDFQNDGQLNFVRTDNTVSSGGTFGYASGEGLSFQVPSSTSKNCITSNTSIYDGKTLKKIILHGYKTGNKQALGIFCDKIQGSSSIFFRFSEEDNSTYCGIRNHNTLIARQNIGTVSGEVAMEINFESNRVYGTINQVSFDFTTAYGDSFIQAWNNQTLGFGFDSRRTSNTMYIRKIEITTE